MATEDDHHLLSCTHECRRQWRSKFIKAIEKKMSDLKLAPILEDIFQEGIRGALINPDYQIVVTDAATRSIRIAIQAQNGIGWNNFLAGKFCKDWGMRQTEFWRSTGFKPKSHQLNWQTTLIRLIWDLLHELWITRCNDRHGPTAAAARTATTEKVRREIMHLYKLKDRVLSEDRSIFMDDLKQHLEQEPGVLSTWISMNKDLILHSVRQASRKDIQHVPKITTFFTKSKPPSGHHRKTKGTKRKSQSSTQSTYTSSHTHTQHFQQPSMHRYIEYSRQTNPKTVNQNQAPSSTSRKKQRQTYLYHFYPDQPG